MAKELEVDFQCSPKGDVVVITIHSLDGEPVTTQNALDALVDVFDLKCGTYIAPGQPGDDGTH